MAGRVAAAAVLALVGTTGVVLAGPGETASARPVPSERVEVHPVTAPRAALGAELPRGHDRGAITAPHLVKRGVAVVGATWEPGAVDDADVIQVRVRRDGRWQSWQEIPRDDEHGPDAGSPEAQQSQGARPGTQPFIADGEQAQVRVVTTKQAVPEVTVDFIDPGTSPADTSAGARGAGGATAAAARPSILTRAEWGADESLRKGTPGYGQAQVAFVHHTVGTNTYTSAQVPGILRGIYDFHVNGRGWNDIGYQFLVDRFGRIWEGRYGGVDKAVVGAQAEGVNSGSFGASVMGDFTSATPPSAVTTAIARLFAWKLTLHGVPAHGTVTVNDMVFDRISGHRDANSTSCPGQRLYDRLPSIRTDVATRMGAMARSALRRSIDAGGTPDVLSYPGALAPADLEGAGEVLRSASPQPVRAMQRIGAGWQALRNIVLTPDFTGDGRADVLAIDPKAGAVRVYSGDGRGGFAGVRQQGGGWTVMTKLVAAGDRTGDRRADLLAVRKDGSLVLYTGDGGGWVTTGRVIASGFEVMGSVASAGDVTGDGRPDLYAVNQGNGRLYLYPSVADGGVGAPVVWGTGWQALDQVVSGPDADRDGNVGDVTARLADGRMRSYYADESGRLTRVNTWGRGWGSLDNLSSGADWNGDGVPDLIARVVGSGDLRLYPGTGQRDFSTTPLDVSADVAGADLFRIVGDLDGDGSADAVARMPNGDLFGLRGRGGGRFDRLPTRIGAGWQIFDLIEPVGDYSNDGVPDLLARTSGGDLRLYTMTSSLGIGWSLVAGTGWQGARSLTGTGSVNDDYNADVVVLRTDGSVRVYRGSGPGALNYYDVVLTGQTDLTRILGVGDLSGDGPPDILAQSGSGDLWLYAGDGKGGFRSTREPVLARSEVGRVLG